MLLKPREFWLLCSLIREKGRYLAASELYSKVWGLHATEDMRTLLVHVSNLRSKLKKAGVDFLELERDADKGFRIRTSL